MIPIQIAGIAVAGSALLAKYAATQKDGRKIGLFKQMPVLNPIIPLPPPIKLPDIQNQLHTVMDGLTSAVSQITKSIAGEDYNRIVKDFLPADSVLLKPRHLSNSGELGLADIDGDLQDELIASYRNSSGVGTIVLKKEGNQWRKLTELSNPGYTGVNFRDTCNYTGTVGQQLLLSFPSEDRSETLHAYSFENGSFRKLFERSCSRFEVITNQRGKDSNSLQEQLAFWNKDAEGAYRVEVMQWNGLQLEPVKDKEKYYMKRVIPIHAKLVRQNPYSPQGWYNLAGVLADAGYSADALTAIDTGMGIDKGNTFKDRFLELKKTLG